MWVCVSLCVWAGCEDLIVCVCVCVIKQTAQNPNLTNGFAMCRVPLCQFPLSASQLTSAVSPIVWHFLHLSLSLSQSLRAHFLLPSPRGGQGGDAHSQDTFAIYFKCQAISIAIFETWMNEWMNEWHSSVLKVFYTLHTHTHITHTLPMFVVLSWIFVHSPRDH